MVTLRLEKPVMSPQYPWSLPSGDSVGHIASFPGLPLLLSKEAMGHRCPDSRELD